MTLSPELRAWIEAHVHTLHGWCTDAKAIRLAELVEEEKPLLAVELGIFGGRSLLAIAKAMEFQGLGHVWGIDPWTKAAALEGSNDPANDTWWRELDLEEVYRHFARATLEHRLTERCSWLRARSQEAFAMFADGSVDFLHQDANHSEETSCEEVIRWLPKMAPGATWVQDDTNWTSTQRAQRIIEAAGLVRVEDHETWALFRKEGPRA